MHAIDLKNSLQEKKAQFEELKVIITVNILLILEMLRNIQSNIPGYLLEIIFNVILRICKE